MLLTFLFTALTAQAFEIETNNVHMADAPKWVTRVRVEKIVAHIQTLLAWDIRKTEVRFYGDEVSFAKAQTLGPLAMAVSNKARNEVLLGPKVTDQNFNSVFTHELTHIIAAQKYKSSVPAWLEEGLASYLAKEGRADYKLLNAKPFPADVRKLTHPFAGTAESTRYHYQASQALTEMIAKKCDLEQLLQMSVGESFDAHLENACEIKNLNAEFAKWVKAHA